MQLRKDFPDSEWPDNIWDDVYHLGCLNWPNCDIVGCGDGEGDADYNLPF